MEDETNLTIGALAGASGISVETVRFYQRRGLLREPRKPAGGIRRYEQCDVARLRFIKIAQWLGFSLEEVASLLKLEDGTHCSEAAEIAQHKLIEVRARLADLRSMEAALADLTTRCENAHGRISCPMIEALHDPSSGFAERELKKGGASLLSVKQQKRPFAGARRARRGCG